MRKPTSDTAKNNKRKQQQRINRAVQKGMDTYDEGFTLSHRLVDDAFLAISAYEEWGPPKGEYDMYLALAAFWPGPSRHAYIYGKACKDEATGRMMVPRTGSLSVATWTVSLPEGGGALAQETVKRLKRKYDAEDAAQ